MESENKKREAICCDGEGEDGVYCNVCDELCIERFWIIIWNQELIFLIFVKDNN